MTLDRTTWEPAYYDDRLEYATLAGSIQGDGGNLHVRDCGVAAVMLGEIPSWQTIGLVFRIQWPDGASRCPFASASGSLVRTAAFPCLMLKSATQAS